MHKHFDLSSRYMGHQFSSCQQWFQQSIVVNQLVKINPCFLQGLSLRPLTSSIITVKFVRLFLHDFRQNLATEIALLMHCVVEKVLVPLSSQQHIYYTHHILHYSEDTFRCGMGLTKPQLVVGTQHVPTTALSIFFRCASSICSSYILLVQLYIYV